MANKIDRIKGNDFKKNPQNINRKGRPKITVSVLLEEIKKEGGKTLTKEDIRVLYLSLLDRTQEQLTELTNNTSVSMVTRIVAKSMLEKKGFDIIERMLDRSIGRPANIVGEDPDNRFQSYTQGILEAQKRILSENE